MKIFLAGAESSDCFRNVLAGDFDRTFASFFQIYATGKTASMRDRVRHLLEHTECIIDSGAHSFFTAPESTTTAATGKVRKAAARKTPDEFFDLYLEWLIENRDRLGYFVELDISDLIGYERVCEWRTRLEKNGLLEKAITVYHPESMSWEDYIALLDTSASGYVGLQGIRRDNVRRLPYNAAIRAAYERGVKVHGFAMTKQGYLDAYPFYSVDSASWKSGVMWGTVAVETDHGVRMASRRAKRCGRPSDSALRAMMEHPRIAHGLSAKIKSDDYEHINRPSIVAYKALEAKLTHRWEARGIEWEKKIEERAERLARSS